MSREGFYGSNRYVKAAFENCYFRWIQIKSKRFNQSKVLAQNADKAEIII